MCSASKSEIICAEIKERADRGSIQEKNSEASLVLVSNTLFRLLHGWKRAGLNNPFFS